MKQNDNKPSKVTINAAKKKNCEKNHAKARLFASFLVLPGVQKYREKRLMNVTDAAAKKGIPSFPKPVSPTMILKPEVILSRPEPSIIKNTMKKRSPLNEISLE